jgi:hypothetical protein
MINKNRIVPIQAVDLISMYGLILRQSVSTLAKVSAETVDGQFEISEADTPLIADEPVKSVDFASGVSTATLYFVPAFDYVGFEINGEAVVPTGEVVADGRSLYKAALASGAVTITKVGF